MSGRRLSITLLCCLLGAALVAPAADAARFPKKRVTYHDKSTFKPAVAEAVQLWNAARTGVTLVPASRRKAKIVITTRARLAEAGRPVAGRGGGVDYGNRRVRGFVKLSRSAFSRLTEPVRVNVAAHELGHALGLGHLRAGCSLMNEYPDAVLQSVCPAGTGRYRCGPQRRDAKALAKLYNGRSRFPANAGTCALPQPRFEILSPPAELTLSSGDIVQLVVRNEGTTTWKEFSFSATFTDAAGNEAGHPCSFDGTPMTATMNERSVAPGAQATFGLMFCGASGTTQTFHVRLVDEMTDVGRPYGVGPVRSVTVRFS